MAASWYVVHGKTGKEEFLCGQLSARRLEAYCPFVRVQAVNPRSRQRLPYFPGYVFVHVDLQSFQLSALRWLPGAVGIVSFGREPAFVPESLIRAIRRRVEEINMAPVVSKPGALRAGQKVLIREGPMEGCEAIFDVHLAGRDRVRVLLSLLRDRQVPVILPANYIQ